MDHAVIRRRTRPLNDREAAIFAERVRIYRLALRLTQNRDAAEDLTQEALLRGYRSRETPDSWGAWLTRVAINLFLNETARKKPLPLEIEPVHSGSDEMLAIEMALGKLPKEQQALLALAHGEGLNYGELAETLGIPVGTVGSRLHAARAAFRVAYGEEA
jgi:RNA polymerase sigma-70 factor, ECF subfamily